MVRGKDGGFRGLSCHAVNNEEHRRAVCIGQADAARHEIHDFLAGGRGQHRDMVVTVPTAAGSHIVVALCPYDIAITRAHTHGVQHDAGQFGAGHEGDGFLHQGHAGT